MIVELTILPMGHEKDLSKTLAPALQVIHDSGLTYEVTAMGTVFEGNAQTCWDVLRRAHEAISSTEVRTITDIRIDEGGPHSLHVSAAQLAQQAGVPVQNANA